MILAALLVMTLAACDGTLGPNESEVPSTDGVTLPDGKTTRKVTLLGGGELSGYDFIQGELVMICHQTLSVEVPYVTLRVEESTLPEHEAHGDIIPAPPEGCGDDLAPLPPVQPDPAQATSIPTATVIPGTAESDNDNTAPTAVPDTNTPTPDTQGEVITACDQGLTVAETIIGQADEDVIEVLYRAGLLDILNNPNRSYILFLPDDMDFEDLEDEEYTDVVLAHIAVANAPLTDGELLNMGELQTLSGDTVTIAAADGGLVLNDEVDVEEVLFTACNGIVYRVNDYLVAVERDDDEDDDEGDNVTICHRTNSERNPYNLITVDESALDAHEDHGDIIPAPEDGCPDDADGQRGGRGNNNGRGNDGYDD
jgi:uncharacterized surface protein with fasciclin (FAS1) repeats